MPKCKFCKQKKEFYSELGYCDECLHEIKAFLKMSKARVQELKEESLTAEPERKKEIGEEAQGLEEALRSYAKRGVPIDKKEYQAQLRAIYAHCGVVRPRKRNLPLTIGAAAVLAAAVGAAVFFGVSWQAQKQAVSELQLQNEQLTMSLADLQMQLDAALAGQSEGGEDGGAAPEEGASDGSFSVSGSASPSGGAANGVIGGAVSVDGGMVIMG